MNMGALLVETAIKELRKSPRALPTVTFREVRYEALDSHSWAIH